MVGLHYPESHMYIPNFILIFTTIAMAFAVFFVSIIF